MAFEALAARIAEFGELDVYLTVANDISERNAQKSWASSPVLMCRKSRTGAATCSRS